jgi:hypothetical protein
MRKRAVSAHPSTRDYPSFSLYRITTYRYQQVHLEFALDLHHIRRSNVAVTGQVSCGLTPVANRLHERDTLLKTNNSYTDGWLIGKGIAVADLPMLVLVVVGVHMQSYNVMYNLGT